jgi:flagellar biosynthesis protein FlhA
LKYLIACLVREGVSVKNIVYIFEKINDYANEPTKEDLLDKVRLAFSSLILKDLVVNDQIKIIKLSKETTNQLEDMLSYNEEEDDDSLHRISAAEALRIANRIAKVAKTKKIERPIIAVPMDMRHITFVVLSEFLPNITVLATEELSCDFVFDFVGNV